MALATGQNGRIDSPALRQPVRVRFTRECGRPGAAYEDCYSKGDVVTMTLGEAQYFLGQNQAQLTDQEEHRAGRPLAGEAKALRAERARAAAAVDTDYGQVNTALQEQLEAAQAEIEKLKADNAAMTEAAKPAKASKAK